MRLIKDGCDAHTGITAGTFYRDEAWNFYELGAAIECADQTTRLLDVKFLRLMARRPTVTPARPRTALLDGAPALGRGLPGLPPPPPARHGPDQVAAFLLCDPFPAFGRLHLGVIDEQLYSLRRSTVCAGPTGPCILDEIRDDLEVRKVKTAIANGELHRFNDFLQRSFIELTSRIAAAFFGHVHA